MTITNFGTSSFSIDGSTQFTTSQTSNSITISGTDFGRNVVGYNIPVVSIAGNSASLTLSGTIASPPTSQFSITLFDSSFRQALYSGGTWSALAASGNATVNFTSADSGFDFTTISGLDLTANGTGSSISATLTGLTAGVIPEPTRALLLGVGLMGIMLRRRRVA